MTKGEDPRRAGGPQPQSGSVVNIDEATPLSWSPGEMAAEHDVYFGTDKNAVTNADTSDTTGIYRGRQTAASYTPQDVEWGGGPYSWRIDEVNTDGTITPGGVWSFSVLDFALVEDFESYTDDDTNNEAIWQHWIDGFGIPDNGSQVGYLLPPYAEQMIVHGGSQSMPLFLQLTPGGITNSEATLTLATLRDWTRYPVDELSLWFRGLPASVGSFVEGPAGHLHDDRRRRRYLGGGRRDALCVQNALGRRLDHGEGCESSKYRSFCQGRCDDSQFARSGFGECCPVADP